MFYHNNDKYVSGVSESVKMKNNQEISYRVLPW